MSGARTASSAAAADGELSAAAVRRGGKDGPSHHVIGGKFAKKKPLPRVAPAIGAAASPDEQRYTQKEASPSSMDSAIKHLRAKTTAQIKSKH